MYEWNLTMCKTKTFIVGFLFASGFAYAQTVPPLMNYQGQLTNASGQPLPDGQYTLTFNVYNVPTGGAAVWGPQAIVADVVDGHFNVVLSSDSTGGDSITTAFVAQPRYVSIRVDAATEILPRQQVLSAPYAIQADRAAVATTTAGSSNIFPGSGNVGIGITTPDRALRVEGAGRFSGALDVDSLSVTGASTFGAGIAVVGAGTVSGNISSATLTLAAQKYCYVQVPGGRASFFMVPSTWTTANCAAMRATLGMSEYFLSCVNSNGSVAIGPVNGGPPALNSCGW